VDAVATLPHPLTGTLRFGIGQGAGPLTLAGAGLPTGSKRHRRLLASRAEQEVGRCHFGYQSPGDRHRTLHNCVLNKCLGKGMKTIKKGRRRAVAYLRTSSAANVGTDKDSEKRQRVVIEAFAKRTGVELVEWFYDPAVSGADPIEARPGFSALLDRLESNGVRTVVVEDASRFARDLVAQELGLLLLIKRDVRVVTANGDDLTDTSDPSRVMMRQIAGSFAQYEKTRLVTKLRGARERIRETQGKCEGRKSYAERDPELVQTAKRLHRRSPKGHRRSLRDIARELAAMGHTNKRGAPYSASCIKSMIDGPAR
jgi:DNA invertase Pin-like site-specific DNA recombinase